MTLTTGQAASRFPYTVPRRSALTLTTAGAGTSTAAGSVRILPNGGTASPSGMLVFSFKQAGVTVTQAGVPGIQGSAFRMYAELSKVVSTAFAVASAGASDGVVTFELYGLDGFLVATTTKSLMANAHISKSVSELFPDVPAPFQGVLRISGGPAAGMSVVALRARDNERGDYLITTTPATNEAAAASAAEQMFPRLVNGDGWSPQFILFSGGAGQAAKGALRFFTTAGAPLPLPVN